MAADVQHVFFESPIGTVKVAATAQAITSMLFVEEEVPVPTTAPTPLLAHCLQQLKEYFSGSRTTFELPLAPEGTLFQQQVWAQLQRIPFGKTDSYLGVARAISGEKAIRAVGAANGKNPLCIIVPCHRVIGSDGSLTGYAGGLWRKEWLLRHEGVLKPENQLTLF